MLDVCLMFKITPLLRGETPQRSAFVAEKVQQLLAAMRFRSYQGIALKSGISSSKAGNRAIGHRQKSGLPLSPAVACRLFHCSVRQCPEVGEHVRRFRRIHHALREEDADHSLCRIGVCRCAEAAVPTESAWGAEDFVALNVHRHSETPAAMRTQKDFGARDDLQVPAATARSIRRAVTYIPPPESLPQQL
jgi:hypothetical protein